MQYAERYGRHRLADFDLDPQKVHLNHGSYGAVPHGLSETQAKWRKEMERNPSDFFRRELPLLLRREADRIAVAFGGKAKDWVFVENATQGACSAVRALDLSPGDHVAATSEIYNAVRMALRHMGGPAVEVEEIGIPVPLAEPAEAVEAIRQALRPETRAIFVDHMTSRSAVLMPVEEIAALARDKDLPLFVDGAHAPGMLEIDVEAIGADWYVGNAHKWLYAPRGCAFFWTRPERQRETHPMVTSHGFGQGYTAEFDWIGTRDPSSWLSARAALDWHEAEGGPDLRAHCHVLAMAMGARLADALNSEMAAPPALSGSMAAVRLPGPPRGNPKQQAVAFDLETDVVISINEIYGADWIRVSAALYNELEDVDRLIEALHHSGRAG